MNERLRRQITYVAFSMIGTLTLLFIYIAYIQIIRHDFWLTHNLNKRTVLAARQIERGKIFDRNGEVLAQSLPTKSGGFVRDYPYQAVFAPLIGYDSLQYGRAGLEATYHAELAGFRNPERQLGPIAHLAQTTGGNSLILTVDAKLQQEAFNLLGNRRGAIVVLDIKTGAVLVSVSKPSFTFNAIEKEWNTISTSENSPLMNRAFAGLYPPGSIVKVMIADAALQKNLAPSDKQFVCEGQLKIGTDYVLHESGDAVHGKLTLEQALAVPAT